MMVRKTWNEFWGSLLMLRCHRDRPERWSRREERADWLLRNTPLRPGLRVLDLGCGDGILDICLAKRGVKVTAVDRIEAVLEAARGEPDSEKVTFALNDLREAAFPPRSFDCVLMLELIGLMGKSDDALLFQRAHCWLTRNGTLLVDCPSGLDDTKGGGRQQFEDGVLEYRWTYDGESRLQHMVPTFTNANGETVELYDPYDPSRSHHTGVIRYLYPKDELADLMKAAGFRIHEAETPWREGYYMLVGEKRP